MKIQLPSKVLSAIMIMMLAVAALPVKPAYAADTGLQVPSANSNAGWTNPQNAYTSDNNRAVADSGNDIVQYSNFNFPAIPGGAIITGIEVLVEGYQEGGAVPRQADISLSWNSGAGYTTGSGIKTTNMPGNNAAAEAVRTFGGSSDTWNRTWSPGDFTNANFRLRLDTNPGSNGSDLLIDRVQVRVYYDMPPEMNVQGNGVSIADGDTTPSAADWTDFGNVPQNFFVDRTFTIQNTGTGDLNIGAITFTGGDAGDFSIVSAPAATVVPGNSTTFTVRLTAGGGGGATRDTTINIANNDVNENPYTFALQGARITAGIDVLGNGASITDGDNSPSLTDHTQFGSTALGGSITRTYTILNTSGTVVLYLGTVTIGGAQAGDFSVTAAPSATVAPNGSTTFSVTFSPSAAGARNATISFINNDNDESPYNWSIQGTGTANTPPTITSNGGGATTTVSVPESTTAVTTVTATDPNVPPQTLTYSISGTDAGDFSIDSATGVLTFSPAPDFESPTDADTNNSYIVIVQVSDGAGGTDSQTITVNVTNANDAPITSNVTDTTLEDTERIIGLSYTDPEGNPATSCVVSGLSSGSISTPCSCTGGACTVGITPGLNSTVQVTANYTVSDGLTSNTSTITLDVTPVNDPPAFTSVPVTSVNQNDPYVYNIVVNDPDVGDTLVINAPTLPAWLSFTDNGNGTATLSGTPSNSDLGSHTVVLRATDGVISVPVEQSFSVVVNDVNDAPSFTSAAVTSAGEGTPYTYNIVTTDPDAGDTLTITAPTLPAWLTLVDNGDRTATLSGTPSSSDAGVHNVVLEVSDGALTANQTFDISVGNTPPQVVTNGINTLANTGDGVLTEGEVVSVGVTQLLVTFNQDVFDPADVPPLDPHDVTNPANYLLVRDNGDGFQTTSCALGVSAQDTALTIDLVTYSNGGGSGPFVATLLVNTGLSLSNGSYRLFVCGTTSIVDIADTTLELAGDGVNAGTDFIRNFSVSISNNGNASSSSGGGGKKNTKSTVSTGGLQVPVTGFAPDKVTVLPPKPADKTYKPLNELRVEIPTLGINFPIVGVALSDTGWDLTWLQNSVAYLEGSAYPTLSGNTVLTAHVVDASNNLGPFSDIKGMKAGQQIYIHFNGQKFVYQVQENRKISSSNISAVFKHEDYDWITLVTCEDYDAKSGSYKYRRMVRAVLISVVPEK
ncbi:hypothetical protein ANAEL_00693 [Anaerolineales bacterium]|nr:hypothetical protein ANAEL_00693 [Anaerolineales bacterium]